MLPAAAAAVATINKGSLRCFRPLQHIQEDRIDLLGGALDAIEWSVQRHEEKSEGLIFHPGYKRLQRSTGNLDQLKKLTIHPKNLTFVR